MILRFPSDRTVRTQTPEYSQAASEFGLTPSSRSRIVAGNAKGKEPEDEMEALLGGDA